jgi:hypothetical protein
MMKQKIDLTKSLALLTMGLNYFNLVQNAVTEMLNQGNALVIISKKSLTSQEYDDCTKWNDMHIAIPVLFNFFHGMELMLKGAIALEEVNVSKGHDLSALAVKFQELFSSLEEKNMFVVQLEEISKKEPLATFFEKNQTSISQWYETLKYPEMNNGAQIHHANLKYGGHDTLNFWQGINDSAECMRKFCVTLYNKYENANP